MRPEFAYRLQYGGYALVDNDLGGNIGNCFVAMTTGARHPVFRSPITLEHVSAVMTTLGGPVDRWNPLRPKQSASGNERFSVDVFDDAFAELLADLMGQPVLVPDVGKFVLEELTRGECAKWWESTFVRNPSLGYARQHMRLVATGGPSLPLTGVGAPAYSACPVTSVPALNTVWAKACALISARIDSIRMGAASIPQMGADQARQSAKERPVGNYLSHARACYDMLGYVASWMIQGPLVVAHSNRRLLELGIRLVKERYPSFEPIKAFEAHCIAVWSRPIHPFFTLITSALMTGTVQTDFGKHDKYYFNGPLTQGTAVTAAAVQPGLMTEVDRVANDPQVPILARIIMAAALRDSIEDHSQDVWGGVYTAASTTGGVGCMTIPQLARVLVSLGEVNNSLTKAVSDLGWEGGKITTEMGEQNQAAANFVITDGETYSSPVAAGLLGHAPVLSMANRDILGTARRTDPMFNTNPKLSQLTYSTMTVRGSMAPIASNAATITDASATLQPVVAVLQRQFMPAGMAMGEATKGLVRARVLQTDPKMGVIVTFWAGVGDGLYNVDGYDPQLATVATSTDKSATMRLTSWDPYSSGTKADAVNSVYAEGWGAQDAIPQLVPAVNSFYAVRDAWYHRYPVKMCTSGSVEFYNEMGAYERTMAQDGYVTFNDDISITYTTDPVEKLVGLLAKSSGGMTLPALPVGEAAT